MQPQIDIADRQNGSNQDDADSHHQDIRVTGRFNEGGKIVGGVWMKQLAQAVFHSRNNQTEKVYSRPLPKVGIIAQAWDLAM